MSIKSNEIINNHKVNFVFLILKPNQNFTIMKDVSVFVLLQAPILLIIYLIFLKKKFKVSKWRYLFQAFGFGLLTVIVMLLLDYIAQSMGYDMLRNLKRSAFFSFVVIGGGAEFGKFLLLRYYLVPLKNVKGPLETILYSIMISIAFTIVALPLFAMGLFSNVPTYLFFYTFPLANLIFAVVMGFFVGLGKSRKNRLIDSLTGLAAASFFHGFYYFSNLTTDRSILWLFGGGILFIALLLGIKSVNLSHEDETNGSEN